MSITEYLVYAGTVLNPADSSINKTKSKSVSLWDLHSRRGKTDNKLNEQIQSQMLNVMEKIKQEMGGRKCVCVEVQF